MRSRLSQYRGFWAWAASLLAVCLVVGGVLAGSPGQAESISLQTATVDIVVVPSSKTVQVHDTFILDIYVYPDDQQVDAVDADMTFDPTCLEVLSITGDPSSLPDELYSAFDNGVGTLTHSQGILVGAPPSSTFRLCSIEFRAKAATDGTTLTFTDLTDAYFSGKSLLGTASGGTVVVLARQLFLPIVAKSTASTPSTGLPVEANPISLQAATVDVAVVPISKTVPVKDTFAWDIYVYPNGQQVDAVDADMTFDPTYLEVQSISGDSSGLKLEFHNDWDNTNGTLTHGRGASFTQTPPSSTFHLCSIEFRAKAATDGTTLAFTTLTDAWFEGVSVLHSTINGAVIINYDLDSDGDVDVDDIMLVASRWRTSCDHIDPDDDPGTPNYDPRYDLNEDCVINIVDIMLVVAHWRVP